MDIKLKIIDAYRKSERRDRDRILRRREEIENRKEELEQTSREKVRSVAIPITVFVVLWYTLLVYVYALSSYG